jgi:hypothetical protein
LRLQADVRDIRKSARPGMTLLLSLAAMMSGVILL